MRRTLSTCEQRCSELIIEQIFLHNESVSRQEEQGSAKGYFSRPGTTLANPKKAVESLFLIYIL
jgi:hypothetical protein